MILTLAVLCILADAHVHGVVKDSATKSPLIGASVYVRGTIAGAYTNSTGTFHLHDVPGDSATLEIRYVGYTPSIVKIKVEPDTRIEVLLVQSAKSTNTIVVEEAAQRSGLATQNVTVLSAAELDEHRGQTFADALTVVPGVSIMSTGPTISKPVVHGMSGQRLVLRNAGVVQEGQQWGAEHAPEIDPFTPARIALVKGPASVMYGPNAMGGVIDVIPRPLPQTEIIYGEFSANYFTNNRQPAAGLFIEKGNLIGEHTGIRLQASYRKAGDSHTPAYELNNTGFEEYSLGTVFGYDDGEKGLIANASLFATTLGIFKGSHIGNATDMARAIERGAPSNVEAFSYTIGKPKQEIEHTAFSLQGYTQLDSALRLKAIVGTQINDRSEYDAHNSRIIGRGTDPVERARDSVERLQRALSTPAMNLLLYTNSADITLEHSLDNNIKGNIGVNGLYQFNDRSGRVRLIPDYELYGGGIFIVENYSLDKLLLSAGLRYDVRWLTSTFYNTPVLQTVNSEKKYGSITASVGARYKLSDELTLSSNIGTAWRPPQVNELYSNDVHHGVATYEIGDSTLREERVYSIDATVEYSTSWLQTTLTTYYNSFDGYIFSVPDAANPTVTIRGTFPTFRFTQTAATIAGADISVNAQISSAIQLYVQGALVRGTNSKRNEPLFLMPSDRARLGLHIHTDDVYGIHDAFVDVSAQAVRTQDQYVPDQDYVAPPPGYVTCDVSVGGVCNIGGHDARFSVSCTNLLNQEYREFMSRFRYFALDPGRTIIVRFTLPFGAL